MRVQVALLSCFGIFATVTGICPDPPAISSATVTCDEGNIPGGKCIVECEAGYAISGSDKTTDEIACGEDNKWERLFPKCTEQCPSKADVVFVLDFSTSTRGGGRKLMRSLVQKFVKGLNISVEGINVAAVPFHKEVAVDKVVHLNNFTENKRALLKSLRKLGRPKEGSHTGKALNYVNEVILATENGNREDAPDVVIVLSDGRGQDDIDSHLSSLWDSGATTYAVGFHPRDGMQMIEERLLQIAQGDPSRVHVSGKTTSAKTVSDLADRLGKAYCVESVTRCNVNGNLTPLNGSVLCTNYNKVGSTCTFQCDEGFGLVGVQSSRCEAQSKKNEWTGEFPRCVPTCQELSAENGNFGCTSATDVGSVCTLECEPGYIVTGNPDVTCIGLEVGSSWDSPAPRCVDRELDLELFKRARPRRCSPAQPAAPRNGSVFCTNENEIGSVCSFLCDDGFIQEGHLFTTCIERGKEAAWTMATPSCAEKCISTFMIAPVNGGITCTENSDLGSECQFYCDDGYSLEGTETTDCIRGVEGVQWSSSPPLCIARCTPVTQLVPEDGGVSCTENHEIGSFCTFYCNDGYDLDGPGNAECIEGTIGAVWNQNSPRCVMRCPPRTSGYLAHGYTICSGFNDVGSICTFMCDFGYKMIGPEKITCQRAEVGAVWSAEPPICAATCYPAAPISPPNGFVTCTDGNEIGSLCTYGCDDGYIIFGQKNTECVSRGQGAIWSSLSPTCKETCRTIKIPPYKGTISCTKGGEIGSVCNIQCEDGYSLKGVKTIACIDRGKGPSWSSDLPICVARCGDAMLPGPKNGKVDCSDENQLGSVCSYACDDGYSLVGNERLECIDNDGQAAWDAAGPSCLANCQRLNFDSLANGFVTCSRDDRIGSICHFICKAGYELDGKGMLECTTTAGVAKWDDEIPLCIARCSPSRPISPLYGDVECSDKNELGSKCTFSCYAGYRLNGFDSTECIQQTDGASWSKETPTCIANCGNSPPTPPQKGTVTCTKSNEIGSVCTYSCDDGRTLVGDATSVCVKNRQEARWSSEPPTCVAICDVDSPKEPTNGKVTCTDGGRVGSICEFSCVNGFTIVGDIIIECARQSNGAKWTSNIPTCKATCNPVSLVAPDNGNVMCSSDNEIGSVCKYACHPDHRLHGEDIIECVERGLRAEWTFSPPTCIATCESEKLQAPKNGYLECTERNDVGSMCSFSCDSQYDLVGDPISMCTEQEAGVAWTSLPPSCIARCSEPSTLLLYNGSISCTNTNEIGSTCTFKCDPGYDLVGDEITECAERVVGAAWTNQAPMCRPRCALYPIKPTRGNVICTNGNQLGSFCSFNCDEGFLMIGVPNATCIERNFEASWSTSFPTCIGRCMPLQSPKNGHVSCTDDNEIGSVCTYACNGVYNIFGQRKSTCVETDDGAVWSSAPATCSASCKPNIPRAPANGYVKCTDENTAKSVCNFECRRGFTLFGSKTTKCIENAIGASWDQTTPTCIATCSDVQSEPKRGRNVTCTKRNEIGSICTFSCNEEYSLVGNYRLRCIERNRVASWHKSQPFCIRKCVPEQPPPPANGSVTCNRNNEIGSVCTYACAEKYSLVGSMKTTCVRQRGQGSWDNPTPRCAGDCPGILSILPENGRVMCSKSNKAGSVCTFQCESRLSLAGNRRTVCVDDGSGPHWSKESPECVAPCFPVVPTGPRNGAISCTDGNQVGSICIFRCRSGYQIDGDLWTTCKADGEKSEWSLANPKCVVRCDSELEAPTNGVVTCTKGRTLGSVCTFTCRPMNTIVGFRRTTCIKRGFSTRWDRSPPRCEPVCKWVGNLRPENGKEICSKGNRIGSICRFECDKGFELDGPAKVTCTRRLEIASWSESPPKCLARCPSLPAPSPTLKSSCTNGSEVGSVCSFQCQTGSELSGSRIIVCLKKGPSSGARWSRPAPICIGKCLPVIPDAPNNGSVVCSNDNNIGSLCRFNCAPGMYIVGEARTKCKKNDNGKAAWDSVTPSCKSKCTSLSSIRPQNGDVFCTKMNNIGSICSFECGSRYSLEGKAMTTCLSGAVWSNTPPTCEPRCPRLSRLPTGVSVRCNDSNKLGSVCTFRCGRRQAVKGNAITTCTKRNTTAYWDISSPTCVALCSPALPLPPTNGLVKCRDSNRAGSVCTMSCAKGFMMLGRTKVTCTARRGAASWSRYWNRCIEKCPLLKSPEYGEMTCTNGNEKGSTCAFSCGPGLEMIGDPKTTCYVQRIVAKWSRDPPTCFGTCGPIPNAPENGRVVCSNKNEAGSTCTFQCNRGFAPVGNRTVHCMADDSGIYWTKASTRCVQEKCFPARESLPHGTVSCSDENNVGSVCKFKCTKRAYKLYPANLDTNVCRDTIGTSVNHWNNVAPCCAQQCPPKAKMDAVIALDSSSSIGKENWNVMMEFVENIIRAFEISEESANFAVFRYNANVDVDSEIQFKDFPSNQEGLINAFRQIPYSGTGTYTGKALRHILDKVLSAEAGNRPNVTDVVIVVTDGTAADDISTPAKLLRAAGVEIFVIGIIPPRGILDLKQLRELAGDEDHIQIATGGFQQLNFQFARQIASKVCGNPCER